MSTSPPPSQHPPLSLRGRRSVPLRFASPSRGGSLSDGFVEGFIWEAFPAAAVAVLGDGGQARVLLVREELSGRLLALKQFDRFRLQKLRSGRATIRPTPESSATSSTGEGGTKVALPRGPPSMHADRTALDDAYDEVHACLVTTFPRLPDGCVHFERVFETEDALSVLMPVYDREIVVHRGAHAFSCSHAGGTMHEERARHYFRRIFRTLAALHESGRAHGDVKPANIMISAPSRASQEGGEGAGGGACLGSGEWWTAEEAVMIDFGSSLSRVNAETPTPTLSSSSVVNSSNSSAAAMPQAPPSSSPSASPASASHSHRLFVSGRYGTPFFSSPECLALDGAGSFDMCASDVWATAVTLYCCLFGTMPFLEDDKGLPAGDEHDFSNFSAFSERVQEQAIKIPSLLRSKESDQPLPPQIQPATSVASTEVLEPSTSHSFVTSPPSPELSSFLNALFLKDPLLRLSASSAMAHPWLA